KVLQPAWARYVEACGGEDPLHPADCGPSKVEPWPSVSVVIPLYGGPNEIETCLAMLADSADLLSEVVVVDDRSPDEAPEVVKDFAFAKLIRNEKNL
ncbi:MAG: glycosyltransferase, partial [Anaerolineae bacterium]|nr:glycosyltransferase [Anaerolineae bacterium]